MRSSYIFMLTIRIAMNRVLRARISWPWKSRERAVRSQPAGRGLLRHVATHGQEARHSDEHNQVAGYNQE